MWSRSARSPLILRWTVQVLTPFECSGGAFSGKMFCVGVPIASLLLLLSTATADPRSTTRRYKPLIQVTEEIDINDITFTTSAPPTFYNTIKPHTLPTHSPSPPSSPFPHNPYKNSHKLPPLPHQPPSSLKYKPYKVLRLHEPFRPLAPHRTHLDGNGKFDPPTTYTAPEPAKLTGNVVPFSTQLPSKAPTRASSFPAQDSKSFIPSPTFSPTLLAHINSEHPHRFPEPSDPLPPLTTQRLTDRPNPTKTPPNHRHHPRPHHHSSPPQSSPPIPPADSHQQSESLLSEISTLHKGGTGANNLDEVADSLDFKTGERVEFQMYGMDGPKSYKFGFDTGKGHNRHFRFEERDNTGKVKGHYGYMDEDGKMRIMKYEADPITGFHAGPVEISPDDN